MTVETRSRRTPRVRVVGLWLAALLAALSVPNGIVSAHTAFSGSTPQDGQTLAEPVSTITLAFTGESEPAGDGFTVLMPDGHVRTPSEVLTVDQKVFTLKFEPPLAGGTVGVRWSVRAPDLHPITGAFSFTVTAPVDGSDATMVMADGSTMADGTMVMADGSTMTDGSDGAMVMADGSTMTEGMSMDEFLDVSTAPAGAGTARAGRIIEFGALTLLVGAAAFAATTLRGRRDEIERTLTAVRVLGLVLAAGALLEYLGVARIAEASIGGYWSSSPGLATVLRAAAGIAIAAGFAAVTAPVAARRPAHSLSAAANPTTEYERQELEILGSSGERTGGARPSTQFQHRSALRVEPVPGRTASAIDPLLARQQYRHRSGPAATEAATLTISTTPTSRPARPTEARRPFDLRRRSDTDPEPVVRQRLEQPAGPDALPGGEPTTDAPVIRRWVADRASVVGFVGIGLAIISFWFDGHTVSKGFRPLHALVNSAHVLAGAVWVGGVVTMAVILWTRHRSGIAPRAFEMVVRFSSVATAALVVVLVAGGVMAILVLDSFGELFSTEWGTVLLLKSGAVALTTIGGAYNHFVVLPALEANPDDPVLGERLRTVVTSEAILLGFVVVVTATLVAAAT